MTKDRMKEEQEIKEGGYWDWRGFFNFLGGRLFLNCKNVVIPLRGRTTKGRYSVVTVQVLHILPRQLETLDPPPPPPMAISDPLMAQSFFGPKCAFNPFPPLKPHHIYLPRLSCQCGGLYVAHRPILLSKMSSIKNKIIYDPWSMKREGGLDWY